MQPTPLSGAARRTFQALASQYASLWKVKSEIDERGFRVTGVGFEEKSPQDDIRVAGAGCLLFHQAGRKKNKSYIRKHNFEL